MLSVQNWKATEVSVQPLSYTQYLGKVTSAKVRMYYSDTHEDVEVTVNETWPVGVNEGVKMRLEEQWATVVIMDDVLENEPIISTPDE